ncbi:SusC/RagA family TonB-linked outer membrane protein [Flagellimonas halotolerans]|uniref:SusC/RagA family TonB-linked outer membrane protein n=1 Tax=Flagellimonas halotolerans TaxID=3112164 RepID=A0ABU6IRM2_9FLAO|nr:MULTISPECIES: SusC/RagA family TonB-linked outer membrane protein [unclassified Allomuricauda]MEC3965902.1 SusC/RagA family TonB-linked outer membrane protein [Muricauda sp. SYSU M86414]MEC4265632.1 SusC/RagA family TonB-linked outer membrane protein [Muricauda sp. SYSU M84420]
MKNIYLTIIAVFSCVAAFGQTLTGTVSDTSGVPLPGVTIVVSGTNIGTTTDFDGNYSITASSGQILRFSYLGMKPKEVTVGTQKTIDVSLEEDAEQLGEVIVTAFGISQEKKSLGYSAQSVDAEAIADTKQTNLVNSLQGQVAGVQITNSGGAPGQSARIIIRGINSLDPSANNQPLFVVDGVPIDNSTVESPNTPRGLSNRAADINPADVESMSVLKGAAATALYGVRAANGAVIITTKKGKKGKVSINLNTSVGFDELNRLPKLQKEYGQGFSGEYDPSSFWPSWGAPIDQVAQTEPGHKYQDNWNRAFDTGVRTDHSLSISGGGEKATFYASMGRLDQKGIIPFSNWDRTTAKISGTVTMNEKFNFGGSINYSNSGGNRVPHDRFMERMMYWAETQDVRDYINEDGTMKTYGNTNPIYDARFSTYEDDVNRIIGNLNFNYSPWEWLTLSYRIGTDFYSDSRTEITPGPKGIDGEVPLSSEGYLEETRINSRDITSNFYITLKNKFGEDFTTTLRLGNDIFERKYDRITSRGEVFIIPEFYNLNNTSRIFSEQGKSIRRLVGFYGDLMLNYKDYLFLNVTGRNDISSTLPKNNNSFFYPSINLGYVFTEHLDVPTWFTFGKLRASWAQVGKDTNPHVLGATFVSPDHFPLGGQVGFSRNSEFGDPMLKPELTTSMEFGAQLSFFDSRLDLDFTYYKSNAEDQIIPVPISDATGFSSYITNAGEIQNSGFEFVLGADIVRNEDFTWKATANLSVNNNEVKSIREGIDEIVVGNQFGYAGSTVTMKLIEGEAYGNLYGSSYERYGANEESIFLQRNLPTVIGDDGFPVRNGDQLILGNAVPKWIGGLRNQFTYKDFELSFLVDFRADVDQYNQFDNFLSAFGKNEYTLARNDFRVFDGVLADGTPNTQEVWLGQGLGPDGRDYGAGYWRNAYRGVSENFVQDASFIKLRNISLAYNLNDKVLSKLPFTSMRISLAANNIILYSPWDGFDPESFSAGAGGNAIGFTGLGFPGTQSYFLTLNFGL